MPVQKTNLFGYVQFIPSTCMGISVPSAATLSTKLNLRDNRMMQQNGSVKLCGVGAQSFASL